MNCASISGGRTSAKMAHDLILEYPDNRQNFIWMFCNTGKERDETLEFVHEIECRWNIPIVWLEYTRVPATREIAEIYPHKISKQTVIDQWKNGQTTHWFKIVDYNTARRRTDDNKPFDELLSWASVLPNIQNRMCSVQMKVRTMMRYLFWRGVYDWTDHIGIRYDEAHRALEIEANCPSYRKCRFPLIESKTTERQVLDFWKQQPFDLKIQSHEGNCDMCFLKKLWKLVAIAKNDPLAMPWWLKQEERFASVADGDGRYFRKGQSYIKVKSLAEHPNLTLEIQRKLRVAAATKDLWFRNQLTVKPKECWAYVENE